MVIAVPTLGAQTFITDYGEILAYEVRHFVSAPKSASDTFNALTYSLGDILSTYGQSSEAVIAPITTAMTSILTPIFSGVANPLISVTTSAVTITTYNITITIQVIANGLVYSVDPTITVTNGAINIANDIVPTTTVITA